MVGAQQPGLGLGTELAAAAALNHESRAGVPAGDGHRQGSDREGGLHPGVDGVADDPVGVAILDHAGAQLALGGVVLGDVRQPQLVRWVGADWRCTWSSWTAGPGVLPDPFRLVITEATPFARQSRQIRFSLASTTLGSAVAELRVIAVHFEDGVDQVRVVAVPVADRVGVPGVEGLPGEPQHPAGHREGNPSTASSRTSG